VERGGMDYVVGEVLEVEEFSLGVVMLTACSQEGKLSGEGDYVEIQKKVV
jgi:hypothetical protein